MIRPIITLALVPFLAMAEPPTGSRTSSAAGRAAGGKLQASRPNVLLFLVDDMGLMDTSVPFHCSADGKLVSMPLNRRSRTPGMERLAASGMRFTSTYACTVCSPTRTSLMTGANATRHHVTTWTALARPEDTGDRPDTHRLLPPADWRKAGIDPACVTLPRVLQQAAYRTIHVGKAHFGPNSEPIHDPRTIGFDLNIAGSGLGGPGSYLGTQEFVKGNPAYQVPGLVSYYGKDIFLTEALTREMSREIEDAVASDTPFFAYMSHYAVHATFEDADPRFAARHPNLRGYEKNFATLIEGMDKSLSDLLDKLETLGVAENTLVFFLGDNGSDAPIPMGPDGIGPCAPYRGKKGHAYDGGLRVPLLVSWAKRDADNPFQKVLPIPAASITRDIVAVWDLFPTVLGAVGVPAPDLADSRSLVPYLRGEPGIHRPQEFVLNFPHSHEYEDFYALMRKDDWKIIYRYEPQTYELYHLATDPGEQANLAGDPDHAARLMRMSRQLARRLAELNAQNPRDRLAPDHPQTPLLTPVLPTIDSDSDGVPDLLEDSNRNGRVDPGETDPDRVDAR